MRSTPSAGAAASWAVIALMLAACGGGIGDSIAPPNGGITGTTTLPRFTGRIVVAGSTTCPTNAWLFAGPVGAEDSTAVDRTSCTFSLASRYAQADTARVVVKATSGMKGFLGRVPNRYFGAMNIVGVPASWAITTGAYAGTSIPIDLGKAYAVPAARANDVSFYLRVRYGTAWRYVVGSFASPPLPTAFCRNLSNRPITAIDSVSFWVFLRALHLIIGSTQYTPASEADVCANDKSGFQVVRDSTQGGIPVGGTTDPFTRDFRKGTFDGDWALVTRDCFLDLFCVQHEMTHGLGFGHTCSWKSNMESCNVVANQSDSPTATDVAYIQLMMAVAAEERALGTRLGLPQAHQFERVASGLTEESVDIYEPR